MKIQEGEKTGEKRGEISPLHLNIIFAEFSNKMNEVRMYANTFEFIHNALVRS